MELREINERERDLAKDTSLWNPIFLQMFFAIDSAKNSFMSLPKTKLTIYDFGCGTKQYKIFCENN
jgi:hypothetical protein